MSDQNNKTLGDIKNLLEKLNKKIDAQDKRIRAIEKRSGFNENITYDLKKEKSRDEDIFDPVPGFSPPTPPSSAPPAPPPSSVSLTAEGKNPLLEDQKKDFVDADPFNPDEKKRHQEDIKAVSGSLEDPASLSATQDKEEKSLEEKIGANWFAKIGMIATVLGISFFLKYAFDNDWIGETGRVVLGIIAGLSLLAFGEKTIRKYFLYGQIISGGGLAVLYLSNFAAFNFYHLIPQLPAFLFMGLISLIGIALSLRYDAPSLVIAALFGGFATPFLIPSKVNTRDIIFIYVIMLDLVVLVVSVFKRWRWLNFFGFLGTIFVFSGWFENFYTRDQLFPTIIFLTVFFIVYSISSLIYNLHKKENSCGIEQILTLFSGIIYFISVYNLLDRDYHDVLGLFAVILAVYYFLWAYLVRGVTPKDNALYDFLAFLSVGFLTIAIPIQFNGFLVTFLWTIEAVLLITLALRIKNENKRTISIFGFIILFFSFWRVIFIDSQDYYVSDMFLLNKVFLSGALFVVACYVVAWFGRISDDSKFLNLKKIVSAMILLASVMTIFVVSRDIIVYHEHLVSRERSEVAQYNIEIRNRYGNSNISDYLMNVDYDHIESLRERSTTALSLFWIIYGVIILAIAMYCKRKHLIIFGTGLSAIVLFKTFFVDLWSIDTLYRPFVSVVVIFASYLIAVLFYEYNKLSKEEHDTLGIKKVIVFFVIAANVLSIFAGSREIGVYFKNERESLNREIASVCGNSYSSFKSLGSSVSTRRVYDREECTAKKEELKRLNSISSVAMSIFWMLYAICLLVIGFWKRYRKVRMGGILLLIISILKLFFVDLWSLGQLYRIIASISLGLVLLGISFMYQKYKHVFREIV